MNERASPRISDLPALIASMTGKLEMESVEEGREYRVVEDLMKKAVLNVFGRYFSAAEFDDLLLMFESGLIVEAGADVPSSAYIGKLEGMGEAKGLIARITEGDDPASVASAVEFVLEGLHLNRRLNRDEIDGNFVYKS